MSTAYALMTAMPPTNGHANLIEFASHVADEAVVIVCTQPDEPFVKERVEAIRDFSGKLPNVSVYNIHQTLPQEPEDNPGFWDMWSGFLTGIRGGHGIESGKDFIVASESYGQKLAEITGTTFIPYDIDRTIDSSKATRVREDPAWYLDDVMEEFLPFMTQRVTIFGAESVGKTTLAQDLALNIGCPWYPEWARPYMENFAPEVTEPVLRNIWRGQKALQESAGSRYASRFLIQDTDLFSTVGYWNMWGGQTGGTSPSALITDAIDLRSDLYIIPKSNIPFEADPLGFGGDKRESTDQYWIDLCEKYNLNYVVLKSDDRQGRVAESLTILNELWNSKVAHKLAYQRQDSEHRDAK